MVDPAHSFHIADYVVFGATIVISIGIGIFYALSGGRQRTTSEYLVGGRAMKFIPVAISLMVSYESSIMMLGLPAEMYVYGVQWWLSTVGYMGSSFLATFLIVPLFHPLRITSAYEYLQLRFNSTAVRLVGSLFGILTNVWYMGIVLFGPAIALEAVTGFSQWSSIFVIACVAVLYTTIGGIKAVIWTDVFQAVVMYSGMLAILIKGTLEVGGPDRVWEVAREGGRLDLFNFDLDPRTRHTFWNLTFGTLFRGFNMAFNQSTVQRISSTRTQREAKWVMLIMTPCFFLSLSMACCEGIVAYAYYQTRGCDPLASKKITNSNQVIPYTVMDIFQNLPGMPGLFLASLFSASLSTLSSGLSSISALFWTDFVKPRIGPVSEMKATIIAKITVIVAGGLACGVSLLVSLIGGPLTQIAGSLLATFGGPLSGIFLLGCFFPGANAKGAILGSMVGAGVTGWIAFGKAFNKNVRKQPFLPPASTDNCLANHSISWLSNVTSFGLDPVLSNVTTDLGLTGVFPAANQHAPDLTTLAYSMAMGNTTAQAADLPEPQGISHLYTLSYVWLGPLGTLSTILGGVLISCCTGNNKKGEVDGRYLLPACDYLCCYLPESVRKLFRCAGYRSTPEEDEQGEDRPGMDKEIIISAPSQWEKHPALQMAEVSRLTGTDVTGVVSSKNPDQSESNGPNVSRPSPVAPTEDNDVSQLCYVKHQNGVE